MIQSLADAKRPLNLQRTVLILQAAMVAAMSLLILSRGKLPGWDMVGLALLTLLLWVMGDRMKILDFSPYLLIFCTYEVIRSVILAVGTDGVHVTDLIAWEQALCAGILPASALQQAWSSTAYTWLVDLVANGFYMTHFFSVIAMGFILWLKRRAHYWPFIIGLFVLSYSGFLTYVVFPAAPPWWASMNGYLDGRPVNLEHSLLSPDHIFATANALGALPSLHTAWPFYLFFYALFVWGRKAMPVLILPIGVAVSSIYLGHHYLVDILAGVAYAAVVYGILIRWMKTRWAVRESAGSLVAA
jgi:membrane-associated phospholipid phosphatase